MIRMLINGVLAIALFSFGAAGSWFFLQVYNDEFLKEGEPDANGIIAPETSPAAGTDTLMVNSFDSDASLGMRNASGAIDDKELPVAVRDAPMSAESIFRWAAINRERTEDLKQREESLQREEMRINIAKSDIEALRTELDGLLTQVSDTVSLGEGTLKKIEEARSVLQKEQSAIEDETQKLNQAKGDANADEQANTKLTAGWLQSMPPETAAATVKALANDGKMDLALEMISFIEDRNVAKILSALDDHELIAEITEKFRELQRPEVTARR